jgi:hypothetical protein
MWGERHGQFPGQVKVVPEPKGGQFEMLSFYEF